MMQDKIHDALSMLDDDLIETADQLRKKRAKRKRNYIRWISAAACFCILAVCISLAGELGVLRMGGAVKDAATEVPAGDQNNCQQEIEQDGADAIGEDGGKGQQSPDNTQVGGSQFIELSAVVVEIQDWLTDGFVGSVSESCDIESLDIGTTVTVKFKQQAYNQTDFPTGSRVHVLFNNLEIFDEQQQDDKEQKIILYATAVASEDAK